MDITKPIESVTSGETTITSRRRRRIKPGTVLQHAIIIFFCLLIILPIGRDKKMTGMNGSN